MSYDKLLKENPVMQYTSAFYFTYGWTRFYGSGYFAWVNREKADFERVGAL